MKIYYNQTPTVQGTTSATTTLLLAVIVGMLLSSFSSTIQQVHGRPVDFPETAAAAPGNVPEAVLEKWKADAGVRAEVDLKPRLQKVSAQNTVVFPGFGPMDLNDLEEVQMLMRGAKCVEDGGEEKDCPTTPTVFTATKTAGNGNKDLVKILVAYRSPGVLSYIKAMKYVGNRRTVEYLQGIDDTNVLTYLEDGDIDTDWEDQWIFEDVPSPNVIEEEEDRDSGERRSLFQEERTSTTTASASLRGSIEQQIRKKLQQTQEQQEEGRQLQTVDPRIIELGVTAESSFCNSALGGGGTFEGTLSKIIEVVADVSSEYEQPNLNFTVRMTYIEVYCDPSIDPMAKYFPAGPSCGGEGGILRAFQDYWVNDRSNIPRDLAQLFSGSAVASSNTIGCAWVGGVGLDRCFLNSDDNLSCYYDSNCNNEGTTLNYGVNYVTYTSNLVEQSNLVTHEMGHNLGSNHDTTDSINQQYMMYPSNGNNDRTFSDQSVNSFLTWQGTTYCVTTGTDPALETRFITAPPSASPAPSSSPSESPAPSSSPVASPSSAPSDNPSNSPSAAPTASPSASPSSTPSSTPSVSPSDKPSASPSAEASSQPSVQTSSSSSPSGTPSLSPTDVPSSKPSASPTLSPSFSPSESPSDSPSSNPTGTPTSEPSDIPTSSPSSSPTDGPSESPSINPTGNPTPEPSDSPSGSPTRAPTDIPSSEPSDSPTVKPTLAPTPSPTETPTKSPTLAPVAATPAPQCLAKSSSCTLSSECCSGKCRGKSGNLTCK